MLFYLQIWVKDLYGKNPYAKIETFRSAVARRGLGSRNPDSRQDLAARRRHSLGRMNSNNWFVLERCEETTTVHATDFRVQHGHRKQPHGIVNMWLLPAAPLPASGLP